MVQLQVQVNLALIRAPCRIIRALRVIVTRINRRVLLTARATLVRILVTILLVLPRRTTRVPLRQTIDRQSTIVPRLVIHLAPLHRATRHGIHHQHHLQHHDIHHRRHGIHHQHHHQHRGIRHRHHQHHDIRHRAQLRVTILLVLRRRTTRVTADTTIS